MNPVNNESIVESVGNATASSIMDTSSILNGNVEFSQLDLSDLEKSQHSIQVAAALAELNSLKSSQINSTLSRKELQKREALKSIDLSEIGKTKNRIYNSTVAANNTLETSMTIDDDDGEDSVIDLDDEDANNDSTMQSSKKSKMFSHLQTVSAEQDDENKSILSKTEEVINNSVVAADVTDQIENIPENAENTDLPEITEAADILMEESVLENREELYFKYPLKELGRRLWSSDPQKQHYTKGCLWSPDGTCLLVPVHLDGMHVLELPLDLYKSTEIEPYRTVSELNSAVHVKEGGTVYDYIWYPFMTSSDPATCCWLASRQHEPIHMWDAFTGELRCSYRGYDDVDEVECAISVTFNNDGQKVIAGYKKSIKIFDTNTPGRDYTSIPVKQPISSFAMTTDNENCITTGSWTGYINHYDTRQSHKMGPLFTLGGHSGGITMLKYCTPNAQDWLLLSGARKDNTILLWDMRNYKEPIRKFDRNVDTNQRIYFDTSPSQKWLISGDTKGTMHAWNLEDDTVDLEFSLHTDCCNGASFHPYLPIISTSSGQFHVTDDAAEDSADKSLKKCADKIVKYENSILLLWCGR